MSNTDSAMAILGIIIIFGLLIAFGPLITIWALNTLFHLAIGYSFMNWLATLWICGIVAGRKIKSN